MNHHDIIQLCIKVERLTPQLTSCRQILKKKSQFLFF